MSKRGHTHKWVEVWNNHVAGTRRPITRRIFQCAVKRCGEMGYPC